MWPNRLTPSLDRCTKEMSSSPPNSTLRPERPRKKRGPLTADRNRIASPLTQHAYDYERHSQIAGPLGEPPADGPYRVQFRRLEGSRPVRSTLLVLIALLFVGGFLTWLMLPAHWPRLGDDLLVNVASIIVTATTGIIGWFAFLNVATLCRATLLARDPVPVRPEPGQRVAFLTTIVPEARSRWRWCADARGRAADPPRRAARRVAARRGRRPGREADVRRARRAPLHPQGRGALEPGEGPAPRPAPSTATTTPGSTPTASATTSCSASTPTTCRCPTSPSACSATSATPTWASSSARRCTATTTASWCTPPSRSSSSSTR